MDKNQDVVEQADERIYPLSKPYVFEEKEYTELVLDFDKLDGDALIQITNVFERQQKSAVMVNAFSLQFQLQVVAAAADVPFEFFRKLSAKDVAKVGMLAQSFLLN